MNRKPALEFLQLLDPNGAKTISNMKAKAPDLVEALINSLYGEAYQREKLTLRERFLVTIAAIMASGNMHPQLAYQTELALRNGVNRDELMEIAYQISPLCGYATAINSMAIIDGVADSKRAKH